jgi:hypothetical protein
VVDDSATTWHNVPDPDLPTWHEIFFASHEGIDLSAACPVCGASELHRWFYLAHESARVEFGLSWRGTGSQWQWCNHCHSYEHSSGLVPCWWHEPFEIPLSELTTEPGSIEAIRMSSHI